MHTIKKTQQHQGAEWCWRRKAAAYVGPKQQSGRHSRVCLNYEVRINAIRKCQKVKTTYTLRSEACWVSFAVGGFLVLPRVAIEVVSPILLWIVSAILYSFGMWTYLQFVSDVSVSIAIAIRDMRCRDVSHNTDRYNVAASTASTNCTKPLQHHRRKQQHNSYLIRACARARAHGLLTSHTFHWRKMNQSVWTTPSVCCMSHLSWLCCCMEKGTGEKDKRETRDKHWLGKRKEKGELISRSGEAMSARQCKWWVGVDEERREVEKEEEEKGDFKLILWFNLTSCTHLHCWWFQWLNPHSAAQL